MLHRPQLDALLACTLGCSGSPCASAAASCLSYLANASPVAPVHHRSCNVCSRHESVRWHLHAIIAASVMHHLIVPTGLPPLCRCSLDSEWRLLSSGWQAVLNSFSGIKCEISYFCRCGLGFKWWPALCTTQTSPRGSFQRSCWPTWCATLTPSRPPRRPAAGRRSWCRARCAPPAGELLGSSWMSPAAHGAPEQGP